MKSTAAIIAVLIILILGIWTVYTIFIKPTRQPLINISTGNGITPTSSPTITPVISGSGTVDTVISQNNNLKIFNSAIKVSGWDKTLSENGPYTVFAPVDSALARVPSATMQNILNNKSQAEKVLNYHIVSGSISDLAAEKELATVEGQNLIIQSNGGNTTINGIRVLNGPIIANNGLIYEIDGILLPK